MKIEMTAVEWLYDQLVDTIFKENVTKDILEQAKVMEQEQLDIKYGEGYHEGMHDALTK